MPPADVLFALDQPANRWFTRVRSPFVTAGWVIPDPRNPLKEVHVRVNGQVRAVATTGLRRQDVAGVYPERESLWSGFATEVFVDDLEGTKADVEVKAVFELGEILIDRFQAKVKDLDRLVTARQRNWRYENILACPWCLESLDGVGAPIRCRSCQREIQTRRGTPIFVDGDEVIVSHLLVTNPTNPNSIYHTNIIQTHDLVLDLGAGNPRESEHHANVVFHEFVHYAYTDVVSVCEKLPYREGLFDAVISKAAFEHLARPWDMADEIYRVLKPGGLVRVDTAFMFPLHGDPYHFFNMTLDGARQIFKRFETISCGVMPYQSPMHSLRAQFDIMLEHLKTEEWRRRITEWRDLTGPDFNDALDAKGHERLAAGVYFEGRKPV